MVVSVQEAIRQNRSGLIWLQGCCLRELKAWSCPLGSTTSGHPVKERGLSRGNWAICNYIPGLALHCAIHTLEFNLHQLNSCLFHPIWHAGPTGNFQD